MVCEEPLTGHHAAPATDHLSLSGNYHIICVTSIDSVYKKRSTQEENALLRAAVKK